MLRMSGLRACMRGAITLHDRWVANCSPPMVANEDATVFTPKCGQGALSPLTKINAYFS